jgi:cytochrome b
MTPPPPRAVRIWDLPTRLFHWALALCMLGSIVSAKIGGNAMIWHFRLGFVVLGLLIFRLVWGLIGGRWSRFTSFIYSPLTILRYARGKARPGEMLDVGHNPLGSLSVFALLAVLAVQVSTGLVADDEIATVGPLNRFVSSATALLATGWHKSWGQWLILALVATHIGAIVFYVLVKKHTLVRPMLGGDKLLPAATPASRDDLRTRLVALLVALLSAALVAMLMRL